MSNPLLEARLEAIRTSLDDLAAVIDDGLRQLVDGIAAGAPFNDSIKPIAELAKTSRERCLLLVARQAPIARDLKYAMGALRIAHDYERAHELLVALTVRFHRLEGRPVQPILKEMAVVLTSLLNLHQVVRKTWQRERTDISLPNIKPEVGKLYAGVESGIMSIQSETIGAVSTGFDTPEVVVELVLATRHIERIAALLEDIPNELHSFD